MTQSHSLHKKGRTHQLPGEISRQFKAAMREGKIKPGYKYFGFYTYSKNALKSFKKEEEYIINRKVRRDRSYLNEIE